MIGREGSQPVNPDTIDDIVSAIRDKLGDRTGVRLGTLVAGETLITDIDSHPRGGTHITGEAFGVRFDRFTDRDEKYFALREPINPAARWTIEGYSLVDMVSGRFQEIEAMTDAPLPDGLPIEALPDGLTFKPDLDFTALYEGTWDAIRRNVEAARTLGLLVVYQTEADRLLTTIRDGQPVR